VAYEACENHDVLQFEIANKALQPRPVGSFACKQQFDARKFFPKLRHGPDHPFLTLILEKNTRAPKHLIPVAHSPALPACVPRLRGRERGYLDSLVDNRDLLFWCAGSSSLFGHPARIGNDPCRRAKSSARKISFSYRKPDPARNQQGRTAMC